MLNIKRYLLGLIILSVVLLSACKTGSSAGDESATRTMIAGTAFAVAYTEAAIAVPDSTMTPPPPPPPAENPATSAPVVPAVGFQTYAWNIEVIDEGKVGLYPSLVIDQSDNPQMIYMDDNRDILKMAKVKEDGTWGLQTFDSPNNDGYHGSLVIDDTGDQHVCRFIHNLEYIVYISGAKWDVGPFITNVRAVDTTLQIDADYNAHIVYFDTNSSELRYAILQGAGWSTQIIANSTEEGVTFPFVLDATGQAHVSYYDPAQGLVYAIYSGGNWGFQVVDPGAGVGLYPSLALDSEGQPHMSYFDSKSNTLKHAYWNGVMWDVQIVDQTGIFTSIALDAEDFVHISYYDQPEGNLKYALGSQKQWVVYVVDSSLDVGLYSSLALDSQGTPRISYYDKKGRALKFASATPQ
jgi:hypothetical protein